MNDIDLSVALPSFSFCDPLLRGAMVALVLGQCFLLSHVIIPGVPTTGAEVRVFLGL